MIDRCENPDDLKVVTDWYRSLSTEEFAVVFQGMGAVHQEIFMRLKQELDPLLPHDEKSEPFNEANRDRSVDRIAQRLAGTVRSFHIVVGSTFSEERCKNTLAELALLLPQDAILSLRQDVHLSMMSLVEKGMSAFVEN